LSFAALALTVSFSAGTRKTPSPQLARAAGANAAAHSKANKYAVARSKRRPFSGEYEITPMELDWFRLRTIVL
jgi:hypothetical protein